MDFSEASPLHEWLQDTVTHRVIFETPEEVSRQVEQVYGFQA